MSTDNWLTAIRAASSDELKVLQQEIRDELYTRRSQQPSVGLPILKLLSQPLLT